MRLWLDDLRALPRNYTCHAHSVNEAIKLIEDAEINGENVEIISLDHDLGDFYKDGGDGICLLDWLVERQSFYPVVFHTANPVGRANMQRIKERWWREEHGNI